MDRESLVGAIVWAAGLALVLLAASPAEARDRPGTPNEVLAWVCSNTLKKKPHVCFEFTNTARRDEDVAFWIEITADGELVDPLSVRTGCPELVAKIVKCARPSRVLTKQSPLYGQVVWGQGGTYVNLQKNPDYHRDETWVNATVRAGLVDMEFDTEYCFRAIAVDEDSGVTSEIWSERVCATAPRPSAPHRPPPPRVSFLQGDDGRGRPGGPRPSSMLIEWESDLVGVGWFEIFSADPERSASPYEFGGNTRIPVDSPFEREIPQAKLERPERPVGYRVCAVNTAHRVCSEPGYTQGTVARSADRLPQKAAEAPPVVLTDAAGIKRTQATAKSSVFGAPRSTVTTAPPVPEVRTSGAAAGSGDGCRPGFVPRAAGPLDKVCAPPAARDRVAEENRQAEGRRDPKGPYGPSTCISGFVWREAYPGDLTCVTPASRDAVHEENQLAASRRKR